LKPQDITLEGKLVPFTKNERENLGEDTEPKTK
jgi:hypothetical protein